MANYRVEYAPKNAAARKRGCVDVSYTVEANSVAEARRVADESMRQEFDATDYKRGKPHKVEEGSPTPPEHTKEEASAQGDSAGDTQSIEEATADNWGKLYGSPDAQLHTFGEHTVEVDEGAREAFARNSDPAPTADKGLDVQGGEQSNDAGSPQSMAEQTELEKLYEQLRNLQESLPYADGPAYSKQELEIRKLVLRIAEIEKAEERKAEPPSFEQQLAEINAKVSALAIGERLRLENVPAEVYHPSIGWGSTRVKDYIKSPALAAPGTYGHTEKKPTKSMRVGTAYHAASLEPELFAKDYTQADKMPINSAEYDDVIRMRNATRVNLGYLLQGGFAEVSYWYRVNEQLVIKCRVDYELSRLALDLKSATDVSDKEIADAVERFGYALQQEHYKLASGKSQFAFLFQQNAAPFLTSLPVQLDVELQEWAELKLQLAYRQITESQQNDYWPVNRTTDDGGVQTLVIGLKGWKRNELEKMRMEA